MTSALRIGWTFLVFFGTYVLTLMVTYLLPLGGLEWIGNLVAFAVAIVVAQRVWSRPEGPPDSVRAWAGAGAVTLGTIGFAGGFFGPMIFAPGANQGPMLGIFITGPAGVVIGAIAGAFYGLRRRSRPRE